MIKVQTLNYMFNNKLKGEPITKIDKPLEKYLVEEMQYSVNLIKPIIEQMKKVIEEESVHLEGASRLLELPEFSSLEVAKNFLNILYYFLKTKIELFHLQFSLYMQLHKILEFLEFVELLVLYILLLL